MRKGCAFFIFLIIIGLAVYFFADKYGFEIGAYKFFFNSDKALLSELTESFLEDIQFKDYVKAATYHSPEDQKNVDIPKLIENIFKIKPEFLDITRFEIADVELDRSKTRAKVRIHSVVKVLNSGKIEEPDLILYWHKADDGNWYMELESSLR